MTILFFNYWLFLEPNDISHSRFLDYTEMKNKVWRTANGHLEVHAFFILNFLRSPAKFYATPLSQIEEVELKMEDIIIWRTICFQFQRDLENGERRKISSIFGTRH